MVEILAEVVDIIGRNRIAVSDYVSENPELVTIKPVQAIIGPKPHKSIMILEHGCNRIIGQSIFNTKIPGLQVLALELANSKKYEGRNSNQSESSTQTSHIQ